MIYQLKETLSGFWFGMITIPKLLPLKHLTTMNTITSLKFDPVDNPSKRTTERLASKNCFFMCFIIFILLDSRRNIFVQLWVSYWSFIGQKRFRSVICHFKYWFEIPIKGNQILS